MTVIEPPAGRGSGAVAAGHEAVARVGASILESGGNAVDAVVAMIAAGCVCEPTLTSFGGGGFLMVGGPDQEPMLLDFFVRQPGLGGPRAHAPWEVHELELDGVVLRYGTGPASVAVPGVPRGLAHAARRFGSRPLAQLLEPSARLAHDGVPLTRTQAGEHAANASLICRDPDGVRIWTPEGRTHGEGEVFRQPLLGRAIELLGATDGEAMYVGEIADALVAWSDARGARLDRADLERFEVIERAPLHLHVGDVRMFANPEPSMGGGIAVRLLRDMLEAVAATGSESLRERDVAVGRALVEAMRHLDPPRTRPPADGEPVVTTHLPDDMSRTLHDAVEDAMHDRGAPPPGLSRSPNTTHVSAIDANGLACGATTTVGYGAGEFVPGTGIHLNNMLAEYDHTIVRPPGTTVPSMMTPAILVSPRTLVQIGSAGSERIPYAIAQVLERMWRGVPLEEAVHSPRFAWDGRSLHAEPGFAPSGIDELAAEVDLVSWPERDPYFGTTNGSALGAGRHHAAGDLRRQATGIVV